MRALRASTQRLVAASAVLGLLPGCAQVISRSTVEVTPRPDAAALVVGPAGEVTSRGVKAGWTQDGDRLSVRLEESRTCNSVRHVPVVRIERVDRRTARGAMWFEYGFGAAAMAGGLIGLIRPEWFSQAKVVNENGQVLEDKKTGYRIGGILTGIGSLLLIAAVVDTVRTRDEVKYADAYRREVGGVVECMDPLAPMEGQTVELLVGKWSSVEGTDEGGGARFLLPGVEDLPEDARTVIEATAKWEAAKAEADAAAQKAAEEAAAKAKAEADAAAKGKKGRKGKKAAAAAAGGEAGGGAAGAGIEAAPAVELGPRPEPMVVKGVLRLDNKRALTVSFVVPYVDEKAKGYEGHGAVEPGASGGPAPGKRKEASAEGADANEDGGAAAKAEGDAKEGADRPSEGTGSGTGTSKTGEPMLKLGGSGAKKKSESEGTSTGKKSEASITLGGSGAKKKSAGTGTTETDEAK